jgi:predicted dehydrogenase
MVLDSYLDDFHDRDWTTETDSEPIRFAMIGLGWWTREQTLPAVEATDNAVTTVLVSGDPDKANRVADDFPSVEATISYDEYEAGEASEAYDAVYIATPNALHRSHVESAANHGKAILCEKPMAASVEDAEAIVETCNAANVPLMIAYRIHTDPLARRARELIRDGAIGEVVTVLGHMSDDILSTFDEDSWRLDPKLSGGATINDIGIYPMNTIRYLLDTVPTAVYARTEVDHDAFGDVGDEHAAFQLEFSNHVLASCTVTHGATTESSLRFVGTEGEMTLEGLFWPSALKELRLSLEDTESVVQAEPANQMREEFNYFATCLQQNQPPEPDGEHGLTDMYILDALYDAAERGERIEIDQ